MIYGLICGSGTLFVLDNNSVTEQKKETTVFYERNKTMTLNELLPLRYRREVRQNDLSSPFSALHRQMNRLFDDFFGDLVLQPGEGRVFQTAFLPRINVKDTGQEIEISAELPGMEQKDVELVLEDSILTLRGEKKMQQEEKKENYYHLESGYGTFQRSVALPAEVDESKAEAHFKNGILTVRVPKTEPERAKKQKIEIKNG